MSEQKQKRVGRYPVEVRERAVRLVREHEREILKAASAFFGAELDHQSKK